MFIGFTNRTLFVREDMFGEAVSQFPVFLIIHSLRMSEIQYSIRVSVGEGTAIVTIDPMDDWDATFGSSRLTSNVIINTYDLFPGETEITNVQTTIRNDIRPEFNETYTLRVAPSDIGTRENFECYDENEVPEEGNYFCNVEITIVDDDGEYMR